MLVVTRMFEQRDSDVFGPAHLAFGTNSGACTCSGWPPLAAAALAAAAAPRVILVDDLRSSDGWTQLAAERPCTTASAAADSMPLDATDIAVGTRAPAAAMRDDCAAAAWFNGSSADSI